MPFLRKRQPTALLAAASPINIGSYVDLTNHAQTRQAWQRQAWDMYDRVGELHYAGRYIANAISKVRLVAAEQSRDDALAPKATKNKKVVAAVNGLQSPKGGQEGLLRNLGLNLFMTGEAYILGYEDYITGKVQWEALSTDEIDVQGTSGEIYRRPLPGSTSLRRLQKDEDYLYRVWAQHPRYSELADSAVRTILDSCELLILYTRMEAANARSRLAGSGILFIPSELQALQPGGEIRAIEDHPFYQSLIQSMIEPLRDEGHPNAVVPIVLFGSAEFGDKIKHIKLDMKGTEALQTDYEAVVKRIAAAIDLPSEVLLGLGDSNHWSAFSVTEQAFKAHLEPFISLICDSLTLGYLRPALQRAGIPDADKYMVWYDANDLIAGADESARQQTLHDNLLTTDEYHLTEMGIPSTGWLDPASPEYKRRLGVKFQDAQLALGGEPTEDPKALAAKPGLPPPVSKPQATPLTPPHPETGALPYSSSLNQSPK